jgi:cobalt-zinc-cadmium resistance protein CzcA
VKVEQTTGLPVLTINIDRDKAARYGLNVGDVQDTIAVAVGGRRPAPVRGRPPLRHGGAPARSLRTDVDGLSSLLIPVPAVPPAVPADRLHPAVRGGHLDLVLGPNQVSRENGKRVVVVSANVRGRDLGSFVEEARRR